jgi:hypothetical protein
MIAQECPPSWTKVLRAKTIGYLLAVEVVSANDVWAAGEIGGRRQFETLVEHWNGQNWSRMPSPSFGTSQENVLQDIAAVSANDIWAVGRYAGGTFSSLILHWDGGQWSEVPHPHGSSPNSDLYGVAAVSTNDVWAVGISFNPGETLLLHWDGTQWNQVAGPNTDVEAVSALATNDVWAVGGGIIHWDGTMWNEVPGPGVCCLRAIEAVSTNDIWAVGEQQVGNQGNERRTLIEHWDGEKWTEMPSPNVDGEDNGLRDISAVSANDIWAVGYHGAFTARHTLAVHWNGTEWTIVPSPDATTDHMFMGVGAVSHDDIWIVGGNGNQEEIVIERYSTLCPTLTATPVPTMPIPGSRSRTFSETGKTVSGLFLDYWESHGGLLQQGYPISEVMGEVSDLDGKPYTVQYFERAVFEYHPENQAPYTILLSQLGTLSYKTKYPRGAPGQQPNNSPGSVLFPETGKRLGGKFLDYWQNHGGLAQQGFPISDEFLEESDLNGLKYYVQYFERAVFESHYEYQPPYDVLLSQLGTLQYRQKYGPR